MKNPISVLVLVGMMAVAPAIAQNSALPLPSPVEKELAAKASNVTEVTLGKNMLGFAAKFMNGDDKDEAATRKLIEGLDGIYVREYEFDKDGEYSMDQLKQLRAYFETPEWTPIVHSRERESGETADVLIKMVNGDSHGIFVLSAEPRELTIVLILGPIHPDQLSELRGLGGLGVLGDIEEHHKDKDKDKDKSKDKGGKGGDE
ncbi:MAG TPA: DUF4252 domain-containing protein [Terracidiphilus sp.]|nr:DUF4252 domain-containing protein [Terracidiphilus sp.]